MWRFCFPCLVLGLLSASQPRGLAVELGETEQALVRRYGAPTSSQRNPAAEKTITFERPGLLIEVELRQGKCVSLSVTKIGEPLSTTEAKRILDENAQGKKWVHDEHAPEVWRREDGVSAYVNPGFINIVTPEQAKQFSGINQTPAPAAPAPGVAAPASGVTLRSEVPATNPPPAAK